MVKGMGGAMDLVAGVRRVIAVMDHCSRDGTPKLLAACRLPLTGKKVVQRVITNLGVFTCQPALGRFDLIELAPGISLADVEAVTGAPVQLSTQAAA
jgi:3-oxoacid CoA-transferase subunit B